MDRSLRACWALRSLGVLALVGGVGGCATVTEAAPKPASPVVQESADEHVDPYLHVPSGMRFPPEVAGFSRDGMARYDERGADVSVGYHRADTLVAVTTTVYIYPKRAGTEDLDQHFAAAQAAVLQNRRGAELIAAGDMQLFQRGSVHEGRRAHFLIRDPGGEKPLAVSHLFLFEHGPWFIKYRATFPAQQHEVADEVLLRFMGALDWPEVTPSVLAARER